MKYKKIEGGFDFEDVYDLFVEEAEKKQESVFVEIGVFMGKSLCYITEKVKEKNINMKIYGIDPGEYDYYLYKNFTKRRNRRKKIERFGKLDDKQNPKFYTPYKIFRSNMKRTGIGDDINAICDYSENAVKNFSDQSIDFLFVDGNHEYNAVVKDIKLYLPKMKKNGLMVGHDLTRESVKQAVKDVLGNKGENMSRKCGCYRINK